MIITHHNAGVSPSAFTLPDPIRSVADIVSVYHNGQHGPQVVSVKGRVVYLTGVLPFSDVEITYRDVLTGDQ